MDGQAKGITLQDILTEKQLNYIICRTAKPGSQLLKYDLRPAVEEGMSGFLGDHLKVMLLLKEGDVVKRVNLFVKSVPRVNALKAKFIDDSKFFRIESFTYSVFDEMPDAEFAGPSPWGAKAVLHTDSILILPDLSLEGYKSFPATQYLDMDHVLVVLTSLARFHAAVANHQTHITDESNKLSEEHFKDHVFVDCPWLRAGIEVITNFLKEFSSNIEKYPANLENLITKWCLDACYSLREYENTLNVIVHKDLWANNILFKYSGTKPINAVLIDFQGSRYAPPAVDVNLFLYCATSRKFRQRYESELLDHYYEAFSKSIDEATKDRLKNMNYDRQAFLDWCGKARLAGMLVSQAIMPFFLLSPVTAQNSFDDPLAFEKNMLENRCGIIMRYARENDDYRDRILEMFEEFVERHLDL